jgi:branched-chain amino acid transport system substrate-binding protein
VLKRVAILLVLVSLGLYFFVFRTLYYKAPSLERSGETHRWFDTGFSVALVWPPHAEPSLVEGVTLGIEEINAAGGRLANKIRLRTFVETDNRAFAQDIVRYPDVLAVIGHELEGTALRSSLTYERHGVLMLAAKSSDARLTEHDFQYVFRLSFDDKDYAHALAQFALDHNWKRVGVLFGRADHGEAASAQFLTAAKPLDITVPLLQSYFHEPDWQFQDFRPLLAEVRRQQFDALLIADELPWAAKLLIDMRKMGVTQPVLATNKLDSSDTGPLAQSAADNLYVASSVDPESTSPAYVAFRDRFKKRYGVEPSFGASQGYEAFMLFVHACEQSGSADPLVVATTLRTNKWQGLFGEIAFDPDGDVIGRSISIKRMQDGTFHTVAAEKDVE